ncbi:hypothetical protein TELCIR_15882 [Teladorsagia circumcincta]|uniref:Uncharacterized protein n=1 Tax=Teladorsagia circumcincta TaxID=45464 RepID=A0A2G9TX93_TELCI|nr:hypothetical protein TELCIR_15882 [Teladorsagia circumcincta]
MLFVSIWSSFAIALYLLNAEKKRKTYSVIPDFKPWKAFVLSCTAFVGGLNSIIGVYYRVVWEDGVSPLALDYIKITIPVAVTLAPLGSFLGSHFHRKVLATFIYVLESLAVIGFLITKPTTELIVVGACIILFGFFFFSFISRAGARIMKGIQEPAKTESERMLDI